jgi:D-arabinose 1-dehydrogenase-like Zn-dependent alcohol dehydrogenase
VGTIEQNSILLNGELQDSAGEDATTVIDFCAEQPIGAQDEIIEASYIAGAFDRLVASGVRYRPDTGASSFAGERSHESRPT